MSEENKTDHMPLVSIVIPMYNEIEIIEQNLRSILRQDYPQGNIEILVVDGGSTDGSRQFVEKLSNDHSNIRLLDNPRRRTPSGLNIGIKNAGGSIVIILGAHTCIQEDFILQNVRAMHAEGVRCTGGTQVNIGDTLVQRAIGLAMGSPFGIPSAPYRFWKHEKYVDTVVYAAYDKKLFDEIGYFDEDLLISEDAELNWRIRKAGYKIFYTPKIVTHYYPRRTIQSLIKQLFRYGILRVNVIKKHLDALKFIHLIPFLFILFSTVLLLLSVFNILFLNIFKIIWLVYLSCILVFSFIGAIKSKPIYFLLLPVIFISIHISWGMGFIVGIFKSHYK